MMWYQTKNNSTLFWKNHLNFIWKSSTPHTTRIIKKLFRFHILHIIIANIFLLERQILQSAASNFQICCDISGLRLSKRSCLVFAIETNTFRNAATWPLDHILRDGHEFKMALWMIRLGWFWCYLKADSTSFHPHRNLLESKKWNIKLGLRGSFGFHDQITKCGILVKLSN